MIQSQQEQEQERPRRTFAEWITFIIASAILSAIAGLVIYTWVTKKDQPPVLAITPETEIREAQGSYYIPFKVTNTGGETAESVQVLAELRINGKVEETGEQQIDFLSSGETEEGAFIFKRNPRQGEVVLKVASYKLP